MTTSRFTVLYTADKHKKNTKKWHDGQLVIDDASSNGKLWGERLCDLDSDPWDYEAGREKKGYRKAPLLDTVKFARGTRLEVGATVETAKHLITIEAVELEFKEMWYRADEAWLHGYYTQDGGQVCMYAGDKCTLLHRGTGLPATTDKYEFSLEQPSCGDDDAGRSDSQVARLLFHGAHK